MIDIYSMKKLGEIYTNLLSNGISIHMMKELNQIKNGIVLRHDMDSEIESALAVAQLEHSLGIKSTYYFLLTCQFYNINSKYGRNILKEIHNLGHEIGLHFDASLYPEQKLGEELRNEKQILEIIIKQKVYSMSLHDPSVSGKYPYFSDIINAYNSRVFSPKNYFSDSRFGFKATMDQIINEAKCNIVQLLFHPTIYAIRNENELPNAISIYKTEIQRFGNELISTITENHSFDEEVRNYPVSSLDFNIKLKD